MTASLPPLDSGWWDRPELRPVLASRDVAGVFRWLQRHGVRLAAIHVEEIETSPEAFHDLLAAVMRDEQRMIIAPDIHHFEVAGEPAAVVERLESNGIKIVVGQ